MTPKLVIVRGGGDLATGTAWMLHRAGFPVLILESAYPSAIRRSVSFCEAVYEKTQTVEGVTACLAQDAAEALSLLADGQVALLVDPEAACVPSFQEENAAFRPVALVDAIIAKKNLGTRIDMAPFVIALGPGFTAGVDCHAVVETMRGHNLGRVYFEGSALPNTGIPGLIAGHDRDRVIHAPAAGTFHATASIGDMVKQGDVIGRVDDTPVTASIDGLLRGILRDGFPVRKGCKTADIDPRPEEHDNCFTISDKARTIGGSVLCAVMHAVRGMAPRQPDLPGD
ncbi:MAG: EF2563 family selenium-dependent molybdenum hydroxylase system protein [Lachnospiraceae bacterium]|nr:EF2563 family selenium-dependent molybdenum hydroxylase system protein [Lachnospiraceae bacterium]